MAFQIGEEHLPAVLRAEPMSDEEFAEFCSDHPDLFFEMSADGDLIIMPPNYSFTSCQHREILAQLDVWAKADGRGVVTDAAGGFVLPNGARRSPDAAWTLKSRIFKLEPKQIQRFWHLSPEFLIEVRSPNDRLREVREKMREWIENGTQLAWMIDPENRAVEIYRPGNSVQTFRDVADLPAGLPLDGFVLNLKPVWEPLG